MRPARRRGVALVVAMAVIGLLGLWGLLWARSLVELRHRVAYERAYEAAFDLAASAEARAMAAIERGAETPGDAWVGPAGTARAAVTSAADGRFRIVATAALEGEAPIELLTISVELVREGAEWKRHSRAIVVTQRVHGGS